MAGRVACPRERSVGAWLSLVEHSVRDRGVGSSNLPAPDHFFLRTRTNAKLTQQSCAREPLFEVDQALERLSRSFAFKEGICYEVWICIFCYADGA